jgi:HAL2 family 3'(2'),5'-bisphosphate nucleotidase
MSDWLVERAAAVRAVRLAMGVTQAVQRSLVTQDTLQKKDKSPVTVADYASQAVVCAVLAEALGDLPVVGEENADELRQDANAELRASVVRHAAAALGRDASDEAANEAAILASIDRGGFDPVREPGRGRYWALDPIDGTKGFLRAEQYAVALALIDEGRVVLGVLGCPNLPGGGGEGGGGVGVLMTATRGGGAEALSFTGEGDRGTPIRVSDVTRTAEARFCESVESGHSDQDQSAQIAVRLGITQPAVRMDSQAKYAAVGRGDASIYLRLPTRADYREKVWDHAAGCIVVEEAGGRVTDITGRPLDFSRGRTLSANKGVVATNGAIHDAVVDAVRSTLGV